MDGSSGLYLNVSRASEDLPHLAERPLGQDPENISTVAYSVKNGHSYPSEAFCQVTSPQIRPASSHPDKLPFGKITDHCGLTAGYGDFSTVGAKLSIPTLEWVLTSYSYRSSNCSCRLPRYTHQSSALLSLPSRFPSCLMYVQRCRHQYDLELTSDTRSDPDGAVSSCSNFSSDDCESCASCTGEYLSQKCSEYAVCKPSNCNNTKRLQRFGRSARP